jgi:ATP-dependent RNA helicase DDX35
MHSNFKARFWKPGTEGPGQSLKEEREQPTSEGSAPSVIFNANKNLSIEQQRQRLPVFRYRNHILYLLEKYQTVVIVGETGSGKSTQIPQYLIEAGWADGTQMVCITQPRRVAAITVASRVAEERGALLGDEVGYAIRFDQCCTDQTRIKFVTDGLLVREMMSDPLLSKYSVILLDEAHERTLYTDIVIGLIKKIMKKRKDLRIIVASATLDAEMFRDFFNLNESNDPSKDTAAILTVQGRQFPVEQYYSLDPVPDYVKASVETVLKIHRNEDFGDVLVFLTGQEEVQNAVGLLIDEARKMPKDAKMKLKILPMYGTLPASEQMKVFERVPHHVRKVVVATNIAEASITIHGIVYVVDCGFVKIRAYNPKHGVETLVVVPTSQASAQQRSGRAGRLRTGKSYRLYTEDAFKSLPLNSVPEMQRSNMAPVILQLKALGIDNVLRFNFLSPPPAQNMVRGLELLYALGTLNDKCRLTIPLGLHMAEFPLPPMFGKMLLSSEEFGCGAEVLTIAAMMQIQNIFVMPSQGKMAAEKAKRKFAVEEGDHITMLNVYNAFLRYQKSKQWCHQNFLNYKGLIRAGEIRDQLHRLLTKFNISVKSSADVESIQRCVTAGFFANAARMHFDGDYHTVRDDHVLHLHPASVLHAQDPPPRWLVFHELVHTNREYMRDVTLIKPEWLYELAPHFYHYGTDRERAHTKRARFDDSD